MQEILDNVRTYVKDQASLIDGRLKLYLYQMVVLALALSTAIIFGAAQHHHAVQTIGVDAEPSVEAAENLKINLQIIDSDFANVLIGKPGSDMESMDDLQATEQLLSKELVRASRNITFNGEQDQLETLLASCFQMEQFIGAALVYEDRGESTRTAAYRDALDLLNSTTVPAADKLEQINHNELVTAYKKQNAESWITLVIVVLIGIVLLKTFRDTERYIREHFRRKKNRLLRFATALTVCSVLYTLVAFGLEWHYVSGVAYNDAYLSLSPLQQVKSKAVEMKSSESRFLVDAAHQSDHEQTYKDAQSTIIILQNGKTYGSVAAELKKAIADGKQKSFKITGVKGLLGNELDNITFDGEMEAALEVVQTLEAYDQVDQKIRQLERSGQHDAAASLSIGQNPGESNWAFDRFNKSIEKIIAVNDAQFKNAVGLAFRWLTGFYIGGALLFVALCALSIYALKPRIATFEFIRK